MTSQEGARSPALIKEELQDLLGYLDGLPPALRRGRAFVAYEQRVAELSRELMLGELAQVVAPGDLAEGAAAVTAGARYAAMRADLQTSFAMLQGQARRRGRAAQIAQMASSLSSVGLALAAVAAPSHVLSRDEPIALVWACCIAVFGTLAAYMTRKARSTRRHAELVAVLQDELTDVLGPRGELLSPAEYYPASTRRIERLVDDLRQQSRDGVWAGQSSDRPSPAVKEYLQ